MRRFFDTNVLVYAHGRDEGAKRGLARSCIDEATAEGGFVVSAQVLAEFYWTALRRKMMAPAHARELVDVWSEQDVVAQTPDLVVRAIALHQAHSLDFRDALIIQAAQEASCDVLFTEDMQHGRRFGALEIVNPFRAPAAHQEPTPYRAKGRKPRSRARA